MNLMIQQGWQCPCCNKVYSPTTPMCFYCPPKATVASNSTPQRKQLTDEQCINQMLNSGFERNSLGWSFTYGRLDYHLLKFARAIEVAHGIKE